MKRMLLIFVSLIPCSAAGGFLSGNDLIQEMRGWQKARADADDMDTIDYARSASFAAYITGVVDSLEVETIFCLPPKSTVGQVGAVVQKYLLAHPERWNKSAAQLVVEALKEAFPCTEEKD